MNWVKFPFRSFAIGSQWGRNPAGAFSQDKSRIAGYSGGEKFWRVVCP